MLKRQTEALENIGKTLETMAQDIELIKKAAMLDYLEKNPLKTQNDDRKE